MPPFRVKVETEGAARALGQFAANTSQGKRVQLMRTVGAAQLVSIYKTFDEEGSPAGSWPRLADSTVKRMKGKAGNHKLLIKSGRLRNSIRVEATADSVRIGTHLIYAGVHQFGSHDRGAGEGPQARIAGRGVKVDAHASHWMQKRGLRRVSVIGKDGKRRSVLKREEGPLQRKQTSVRRHTRYQNIPARPYLVFRPEDPARIEETIRLFYVTQARDAGLEAK
jgi:phage virion morphogenesis protein